MEVEIVNSRENYFVFGLMAVLFLSFGQLVFAASSQSLGGTLSISGLQYLPSPATPGQYVDVWINVQNTKYQADSIACELRPEYPFSIDANEDALRTIGTLGPGQNFVLKYKVRIDPSAVLGDNSLKVACKTSDSGWIEAKTAVSIQAQSKSLIIEKVFSNPSEIEPGYRALVVVEVANIAPNAVREVTLRLDLASADLPLAPIGSATEQNIALIPGNSNATFTFNVVALADAAPKAYKVPLKLLFKDYLGNTYSLNDTAGIVVNAKPVLEAFIEQSKLLRDGTTGTVIVKVVNRGLGSVKFLNIGASDTPTVKVVEPKEFYAGNLESDDFDTIEYKLAVNGAGSKAVLPLTLSYRDANNHEYSQDALVEFKLYTQEEISKFGLEPEAGTNWLLVIAVMAIAGFLLYRFYWKKRK